MHGTKITSQTLTKYTYLLTETIKHVDDVTDLKFSNNSKQFFSASSDKTIKMWNMKTGEELKVFKGYLGGKENHISKVNISKNSKFIVVSKFDKTIVIMNHLT